MNNKQMKREQEQTIQNLNKLGYQVFIKHGRYYGPGRKVSYDHASRWTPPQPKGGETLVNIVGYGQSALGLTRCARDRQFNKNFGIMVALGRAMKNLEKQNAE